MRANETRGHQPGDETMKTFKFSKAEIKKLQDELAVLVAMRGDDRYCQPEVIGQIKAIEHTLSVVLRK
jgi:hypothetical protein